MSRETHIPLLTAQRVIDAIRRGIGAAGLFTGIAIATPAAAQASISVAGR